MTSMRRKLYEITSYFAYTNCEESGSAQRSPIIINVQTFRDGLRSATVGFHVNEGDKLIIVILCKNVRKRKCYIIYFYTTLKNSWGQTPNVVNLRVNI